jgi:hypothetical protein
MTKKIDLARFILNEEFIFGAPRCIRCGRSLKKGEQIICTSCKNKRRFPI